MNRSDHWLLGVESRDFSHAEKERTACKAEQIHKMTTIFPQNCCLLNENSCHFVNFVKYLIAKTYENNRM